MNDDFIMNALYSGAFTEGRAIQETLFQHDSFVMFMVYLNNCVTNKINWFYYIHFLFIWIPIIAYLTKFIKVSRYKDILNVEMWLILFVGIWISKLFTFTWTSSVAGILAWLWFWRIKSKSWTDWFWIILLFIISTIVRPQSFMLIALIACIIKFPNLFTLYKNPSKATTLKLYLSNSIYPFIIILIVNQILINGHINYANEEKFPISWVTEESGLKDDILDNNPNQYDVVDYNVSKSFYFDDRFNGSELGLSRQSVVLKKLLGQPISYLVSQFKRFTTKLFKILTSKELLILLATFLVMAQKEYKKELGIRFILIITFFGLFYLLTNMHILKERVIVPPIIFLVLYLIINHSNGIMNFNIISLVLLVTIAVYTTGNGIISNNHRKQSEHIISNLNKSNLAKQYLLYLDGGLNIWGKTFAISRIYMNKVRFSMLPGGWGMRSSTFESILKNKGFSNLDEAYKSGKLAFLSTKNELTEPWNLYFNKYYKEYHQVSRPITLLGEKAYAITLVKK